MVITIIIFIVIFTLSLCLLGVLASTCNPATLEIEFRNSVDSIPVEGNINSWLDCVTTCNPAQGQKA